METEYIIIVRFNTKLDGLNYLHNNGYQFVFTDGDIFYDAYGVEVIVDFEHETHDFDKISLQVGSKDLPGSLYIDNGFIKYFKEV